MPSRSFDAFPEQAAAIPLRRVGRDLQICVIRRKDADRWGIPKGLVDPGATHEETALNEAWEEAGIKGRLLGAAAIGTYRYRKWGTRLTVAVFLMELVQQAPAWEESTFRERRWVPFAEAGVLLADHPVAPLLDRAYTLVTAGRLRLA
jgi:phosphohistidine phosphatase